MNIDLVISRGSILYVCKRLSNRPLIGAEIGVMDAVNAENMLMYMPNLQHLYLIDPFTRGFEVHKPIALNRLEPFGNRKTLILKEFGNCTNEDIPELSLDFIYIDGDHSYEGVKIDLEQAVRFVKSNGIICGHDFQMDSVSQAVRDYCKQHNHLLSIWGGEWWFINAENTDASFNYSTLPRAPEMPHYPNQH